MWAFSPVQLFLNHCVHTAIGEDFPTGYVISAGLLFLLHTVAYACSQKSHYSLRGLPLAFHS